MSEVCGQPALPTSHTAGGGGDGTLRCTQGGGLRP